MLMTSHNHVYQKQGHLLLRQSAVLHNVAQIRSRTDRTLIAVIKDNGYGTGLYNEYAALRQAGIDFFAVINAEEARQLRSFGFTGQILLLTPEFSLENCCDLLQLDIIFMLGSAAQASLLQRASHMTGLTARIHLKIDTGLGRYGFSYQNLNEIPLSLLNEFSLEGCYTHVASGTAHLKRQLALQKRRFDNALMHLRLAGLDPGMTHMAASPAFLLQGDMGYDAVRIGSLLLGRCPLKTSMDFQDAVSFQTYILQTRLYPADATFSYRAKKLRRETLVGLLPVGNGDGVYTRSNLSALPVLACGLDFTLLDLTGSDLHDGDEISLLVNPLLIHSNMPRRLV